MLVYLILPWISHRGDYRHEFELAISLHARLSHSSQVPVAHAVSKARLMITHHDVLLNNWIDVEN